MKINNLTNSLPGNRSSGGNLENDLGFGVKVTTSGQRLINHDGSFNVRRVGIRNWTPYQTLVEMSWPAFFMLVLGFYTLANVFFALLFLWAGIENLAGVTPGSWWHNFMEAFFFSMQTFTTVGYGYMSPQGIAASLIASIDALAGLLSFALITGLFFARFAKPKAQILFSSHALIASYKDTGLSSFQFRIANRRNNKVIDLSAVVTLTWIEAVGESRSRRFFTLPLERSSVVLFPLNWNIVHVIDESSPLYGKEPADLEAMNAEFIILIQGFDETYSQQVHTNSSYTWQELMWGGRFAPMYQEVDGVTIIELNRIDEILS